ncbi:hypothetical protein Taro_008262, partial [Colocasia esculenta]|nr:hypothetical protein [Colocasia esculenta]
LCRRKREIAPQPRAAGGATPELCERRQCRRRRPDHRRPSMVGAAFRCASFSADLRPLSKTLLAARSAPLSTCLSSASDPLLEQFVPWRVLPPPPPLPIHHRREVFVGLSRAVKTPGWLPALRGLSLGFQAHHLAGVLESIPARGAAVGFLGYVLPDTSVGVVRCCCVAARLLLVADPGGDGSRKPLAEEVVALVIRRMGSAEGRKLSDLVFADGALSPADYSSLSLLLGAFLRCGMAAEAVEVLGRIRSRGLRPNLRTMGCLIKLLFRRCELGDIWKVFREMIHRGPLPSVRSFNEVILGFCLRGDVRVGESLLEVMHRFQRQPDACSFNIVIKAHCLYGQSSDAFRLYQMMQEAGCPPNVKTFNILIHALCREGRMVDARRLFDEMLERGVDSNTITYNVLMDGYVKAGQIDKACSAFREMMARGMSPDCYTFNILVAGHLKFRWEEGERLMSSVLNAEEFSMDSMLDFVISGCCWEGQLDKAREHLEQALEEGKTPSIIAFNAVIAAYSKAGLEEEAFELYHVMRMAGIEPSAPTCNYLLMCLCDKGRMCEARDLANKMLERGFRINKSTFTILVDGSFRIGDVQGACGIWEDMRRHGVLPDVIAFSAYINGLCRAGYMDKAYDAFYEMRQRQLIPNNFVYNSLINGLVQDGNLADAWNLEREMMEGGLAPDVVTRNIIIKGLCKEKLIHKANDMFLGMYSCGLVPDVVTYNTLIGAYCRMHDINSAWNAIRKMTSEGCDPDITTYNIWIHGLSIGHKMNQAMRSIDDLLSRGIIPNTVTYNTLMNGICTEVRHNRGWLIGP